MRHHVCKNGELAAIHGALSASERHSRGQYRGFVYTYIRFGGQQPELVYPFGGMLPDALQRGEHGGSSPMRFCTPALCIFS
ncbi:hypothetical protein [Gordoniibacillus kamchatkensis]|uniref:hypothetical protein n=1 Tax=Gordoniibacillus kamchatkensis TaxID=1590651 RepID=UPI001E5DCE76|nr:hypothetical protein [Paenibacillus sp. VKM B-2647]